MIIQVSFRIFRHLNFTERNVFLQRGLCSIGNIDRASVIVFYFHVANQLAQIFWNVFSVIPAGPMFVDIGDQWIENAPKSGGEPRV